MRTYNKNRLHSFKCKLNIEKEVKISRTYTIHGKLYTDIFYAEKTDIENILIIPDSIVKNFKDNSPYGFTGEIKDGSYKIDNREVTLENIHSVFNGEGYATIKEIGEKK